MKAVQEHGNVDEKEYKATAYGTVITTILKSCTEAHGQGG
jgi:hypothetical protein